MDGQTDSLDMPRGKNSLPTDLTVRWCAVLSSVYSVVIIVVCFFSPGSYKC